MEVCRNEMHSSINTSLCQLLAWMMVGKGSVCKYDQCDRKKHLKWLAFIILIMSMYIHYINLLCSVLGSSLVMETCVHMSSNFMFWWHMVGLRHVLQMHLSAVQLCFHPHVPCSAVSCWKKPLQQEWQGRVMMVGTDVRIYEHLDA